MAVGTQRALSRAEKLQAAKARLAEAIAVTEEHVAATLAGRSRTQPQDADRLMALSQKAAMAAARLRELAKECSWRREELINNTQRALTQADRAIARSMRAVHAFAVTEDKVAATFAELARTRPQDADRLQNVSERARRQAALSRQWVYTHSPDPACRRAEEGLPPRSDYGQVSSPDPPRASDTARPAPGGPRQG